MNGSDPAPPGFQFEQLAAVHDRADFRCGNDAVDAWLHRSARQSQTKHLTVTQVLTDGCAIASFYSLAPGTVSLDQLPAELTRKLPRYPAPILTLAWLGVDERHRGKRLGTYTFLVALRHCLNGMRSLGGVAVIIDCIDEEAAAFYDRFDFSVVPGYPLKRVIPLRQLAALLSDEG